MHQDNISVKKQMLRSNLRTAYICYTFVIHVKISKLRNFNFNSLARYTQYFFICMSLATMVCDKNLTNKCVCLSTAAFIFLFVESLISDQLIHRLLLFLKAVRTGGLTSLTFENNTISKVYFIGLYNS